MRRLLLLSSLLVLFVGICTRARAFLVADWNSASVVTASSSDGAASSDDDKQLAKVAEKWASLWSEKKLDQIVELYAPDAVFLTGQGVRITGREAIRALFKTAFANINPQLTVRSIGSEQSGSLGYDSGEYSETLTPVAGGASRTGKGNYVIVFKRQPNGKWLIVQHVWTDVPGNSNQ